MKQSNGHGGPRIGRALATAAVALLCVAALSQPNLAHAGPHGGGGGSGGGSHGGGGFHGGGGGGGGGFRAGDGGGGRGFHGGGVGGFHGGGFDAGFGRFHRDGFYGGGFYGDYPSDGYSDYGQTPSSPTWYYCADPAGYYPYVTQCNTDWQSVPAS